MPLVTRSAGIIRNYLDFFEPFVVLTFILIVFILTGVLSPLTTEYIYLHGGCDKSTMLIALPGCIGMTATILVNRKSVYTGKIRWRLVFINIFMDSISYLLNINGLIYAGSAIYTVVHSSVILYTAAFSFYILKRPLNRSQILSVSIVMIGLAVASLDAEKDGQDVLFGVALILFGTMLHAGTYIITEYLLVEAEHPISPQLLCFLSGVFPGIIYFLWQLVYTIPRFEEKVFLEIVSKNGNVTIIFFCYIILTFSSFINSLSFYYLICNIGSMSTGITKCIQSLLIFVLSHILYCSSQESQCYTKAKGLSLTLVLSGVLLYTYSTTNPEVPIAHSYIEIEDVESIIKEEDLEIDNSKTRQIIK